jgi:hypothetical protein
MGFRNRLINGGMVIDQRNAGASVTLTNSVAYVIDRFRTVALGTSLGFSTARSTTAPSGFTNSLLATVTTAKSPGSSDQARVNQYIEGFNVADLAWGTASAQAVTLSFWVRSSVTGTYCVALGNADSATRSYVATYTVNAANTFEYKTITIPGDTSGTWTTGNSVGLGVSFALGCGSGFNAPAASTWYGAEYLQTSSQTAWINNSGATFYITGVQLEAGTVASPFERRDYGRELMMCQRYFEALSANASGALGAGQYITLGVCENTTRVQPYYSFKVQKRVAPSTTLSTISSFGIRSAGSSVACSSGAFGSFSTAYAQGEFNNAGGGLVAGGSAWLTNHTGAATIEWSAEL